MSDQTQIAERDHKELEVELRNVDPDPGTAE